MIPLPGRYEIEREIGRGRGVDWTGRAPVPAVTGRLTVYKVPLDRATFRHPATGAEIKDLALETLRKAGRIPAGTNSR